MKKSYFYNSHPCCFFFLWYFLLSFPLIWPDCQPCIPWFRTELRKIFLVFVKDFFFLAEDNLTSIQTRKIFPVGKGGLIKNKNLPGSQREGLVPCFPEKSPSKTKRSEIFWWATEHTYVRTYIHTYIKILKGTYLVSRNHRLTMLVLRVVYRHTCQ